VLCAAPAADMLHGSDAAAVLHDPASASHLLPFNQRAGR
jgi:hypothetical protein